MIQQISLYMCDAQKNYMSHQQRAIEVQHLGENRNYKNNSKSVWEEHELRQTASSFLPLSVRMRYRIIPVWGLRPRDGWKHFRPLWIQQPTQQLYETSHSFRARSLASSEVFSGSWNESIFQEVGTSSRSLVEAHPRAGNSDNRVAPSLVTIN